MSALHFSHFGNRNIRVPFYENPCLKNSKKFPMEEKQIPRHALAFGSERLGMTMVGVSLKKQIEECSNTRKRGEWVNQFSGEGSEHDCPQKALRRLGKL